jgi:hypothetical protein
MSEISVQKSGSVSGSSLRSELTGKKKIIYNLLVTTNYDGATIAERAGTNTEYVYKVINELKKEGRLPYDFTLRDRRGSNVIAGEGQPNPINYPRHSASHNNNAGHASVNSDGAEKAVATAIHSVDPSPVRKRQEKSMRVKIWKMLKKGVPDVEIIMQLDAEPEEFRREKAQYLRTIKRDGVVRLYEKGEGEIDAVLELNENMLEEDMEPSKYVGYLKYTPSLMHVKEELQREQENLDKIKKEVKDSGLMRKLIKDDIDTFTVDRDRLNNQLGELFKKSSMRERRVEWLERRETLLRKGISALKNDNLYRKLMEYITKDKDSGIMKDEVFMDATVEVFSDWMTNPAKQAEIKKLLDCEKNKDKKGASEIKKKLWENWLLIYAVKSEMRNPTSLSFMNAATFTKY